MAEPRWSDKRIYEYVAQFEREVDPQTMNMGMTEMRDEYEAKLKEIYNDLRDRADDFSWIVYHDKED